MVYPHTEPPWRPLDSCPHIREDDCDCDDPPRSCHLCGCTDDDACEGGCSWVAGELLDLCTACQDSLTHLANPAYAAYLATDGAVFAPLGQAFVTPSPLKERRIGPRSV